VLSDLKVPMAGCSLLMYSGNSWEALYWVLGMMQWTL
jgi:hypothetical protein